MLRRDPVRLEVPGYTPRLVATAEQIFVCVTDHSDRDAQPSRRLDAFDWSGRPIWSRPLPDGRGAPCIDSHGILWLAEPRALLGIDRHGTTCVRLEPSLPFDGPIGAFLPLDDGFVLALDSPPDRPDPRGRVLRIDRAGALSWTCELLPERIERDGVAAWTAASWSCAYHLPLAVAGSALLCGFYEERSGFGQRHILDLDTGRIAWTSPLGPLGQAAIAGPDTFLLGTDGYGASVTHLVAAHRVLRFWRAHGHYLVAGDRIRAVDRRTAALEPDGTVTRGDPLPGDPRNSVALADGSIFTWGGGALLRLDPRGSIVERRRFGHRDAVAARLVTDGQGRFACPLSDGEYGRDAWPVWIFDTVLPALAPGPWPCDGRSARNLPVLA